MKIKLLLLIIFFINSCTVDHHKKNTVEEIDQSIKNGNIIVQALDKYFQDNKKYPESNALEFSLIPRYLDKIPKPKTESGKFDYNSFIDNGKRYFSLSFKGSFSDCLYIAAMYTEIKDCKTSFEFWSWKRNIKGVVQGKYTMIRTESRYSPIEQYYKGWIHK